MEFLSAPWWSALLAIILIDLVLAGDNAIVIALAARRLPVHLQKKAIVWGTLGAVALRVVMTLVVVWLLRLPGLLLVGGLGLLWIGWQLLVDTDSGPSLGEQPRTIGFWGAMRTIMIADALMGVDNVLGVAGAARGAMDLVVIGLLVSIPIMVFGSTLVLKAVGRFPIIIELGGAVLAWTAGTMVVTEPLLRPWLTDPVPALRWLLPALCVLGLIGLARWRKARLATAANEITTIADIDTKELKDTP